MAAAVLARANSGGAERRSASLWSVELTVRSLVPGLADQPGAELVTMLEATGAPAGVKKFAFGSEAGYFQSAGMETVVCGPGHIEQAHIATEYVSVDQVRWCENALGSLVGFLGHV